MALNRTDTMCGGARRRCHFCDALDDRRVVFVVRIDSRWDARLHSPQPRGCRRRYASSAVDRQTMTPGNSIIETRWNQLFCIIFIEKRSVEAFDQRWAGCSRLARLWRKRDHLWSCSYSRRLERLRFSCNWDQFMHDKVGD